jgi:integrase
LIPALEEAGVEWAGVPHVPAYRGVPAVAEGRNVVQVQRWLGHHSASFTLDTYVHLLDGDIGTPLEPAWVNTRSTPCMQNGAIDEPAQTAETAN